MRGRRGRKPKRGRRHWEASKAEAMRNGPEVLICVSGDATLTLPCPRQIEIERILAHFLEGKTGDDSRHPELCVDWAQNLETARSDTHTASPS